ncbi:MAG: NADH-quinone oxidoreductase subunit NuoK [Phycisphaerae bacterium]|nr:NADH-quinone oxidoreductase subunit NuoK [Phycisphaerae bacterium]
MSQHLLPYIVLSGLIFTVGLVGFVTRRNLIVMFLSSEVMFQAVIIAAVAFGRFHGTLEGQAFVMMLLAVAAAEAAVGLALIIVVFRGRQTLDAETLTEMRG